jgi:hypothetical protein
VRAPERNRRVATSIRRAEYVNIIVVFISRLGFQKFSAERGVHLLVFDGIECGQSSAGQPLGVHGFFSHTR